jgi:flagellar biosynthesis/type III secretory pathway protein FliH
MNFLQFYVRLGSSELDREFDLEIDRAVGKNEIPMTFGETILMIVKEEGVEEGLERGLEKGIEKGRLERDTTFAQNLLRETKFSIEEIARLAGVTVEFVKEVKQELS